MPFHLHALALLIAVPVRTLAVVAFEDPVPFDLFGAAMDVVDDYNGDGVRDLLVGDPARGTVYLIGLPDRRLIRRHDDAPASYLAGIGDVDGDGAADYAIGAMSRDRQHGCLAGRVQVRSGRSGALLVEMVVGVDAERSIVDPAMSFCPLGDVDGDGHGDYAWCLALEDPAQGSVRAISGKDHSTLWTLGTEVSGLGVSAVALGDLDGDDVGDFAVGSVTVRNGDEPGRVLVCSGKAGTVLLDLSAPPSTGSARRFGYSLARYPDSDSDGLADLLVGRPYASTECAVVVFSTASGALLSSWKGSGDSTAFGTATCALDRTLLVAAPVDVPFARRNGVQVFEEGKPERFITGELSADDLKDLAACSGSRGYLEGDQWNAYFGASLVALDDLTGDGAADFAVGAACDACMCCPGTVGLYDGRTFERIGPPLLACRYRGPR